STIVSDLRIFCHPDAALAGTCQISETLQSAVRLLSAPLRDCGAELHEDLPEEINVRGDRNQLTLVFLNLIKNAIDAHSGDKAKNGTMPKIWLSAKNISRSRG